MTLIHVQNYKKLVKSLKYTQGTQSLLCLIFLMCEATMYY